ncbi:DUF167 family protein [Cucumibacter marinus]|uniref:DUF167 family protein n=1 Tax=Cucumibacter marinus TaxID=1121252 RepID=UPI0003FBF2D4|nr:DUF167 family protein [Cucumibacter marinus]
MATGHPLPWRETGTGLVLTVRVAPGAARNHVAGIEARDNGEAVLRVSVTAPPDKGRANKAVIALLAKSLGLRKSDFSIVAGETARQKSIAIAGDKKALASLLASAFQNTSD